MTTVDLSNQDCRRMDCRGVLLLLWREKFVVLSALLVGLLIAFVILTFMPSRYSSSALLLIQPASNSAHVLSEVEVLRSRSFVRKMVNDHNLVTDPELNARFAAFKDKNKTQKRVRAGFKDLSLYKSNIDQAPEHLVGQDVDMIISHFLDNLVVQSVPGSNAIEVTYLSVKPQRSALMANLIANSYIEQRLDRQYRAVEKSALWRDKRLALLRADILAAEQAVEAFKKQNPVQTKSMTLSQRFSDAQATYEMSLEALRQVEETEGDTLSGLVGSLKVQVGTQERALKTLSMRYGPRHPKYIQAMAELDSVRRQLRAEMKRVPEQLRRAVAVNKQRVDALEAALMEDAGDDHVMQLRVLEREVQVARSAFEAFLQTTKVAQDAHVVYEPGARVLSYGTIPYHAVYPNRTRIVSFILVLSLFVGLLIVFLSEMLDNTFRSGVQLEARLPFSCFAMIPALKPVKSQVENGLYVIENPSCVMTEAVRSLRTALNLHRYKAVQKERKIVTITSSFPGEGKTTLAVWLARLASKSGEKVLLIDGDLRRPNVHRCVDMKNDVSLVDYLTDQKELDDVIQKDAATGLHVILGASVPNSALDLVSSYKMEKLLSSLKQVYDLVIIDTPACLAVSDACVMASYSDSLLYAVSWGETPCDVVESGVRQFIDMDYKDVGLVMSNVDVKRHVKYAHGDAAYYYGRYQEGYREE